MEKKKPENRFFDPADKTENGKATRILTIAVMAILSVSAILVGILAALNRNQPLPPVENNSTPASESQTVGERPEQPVIDVNKLPELGAPAVGAVSRPHSVDMPLYSVTMNDYRTHDGIDIVTGNGAGVYAVADGKVEKIWEDPMMGTCLSVSMNGKAVATYANLGAVTEGLVEGCTVKKGDPLASVGETALLECCDEPHLHFSMTVDGKTVDPLTHFTDAVIETSLTVDQGYED